MTANRVILMACSDRKLPVSGRVSADRLYAGPLWQTLSNQVRINDKRPRDQHFEFPFSMVLSAKYGFISSCEPIERYDQVLTKERAEWILSYGTGFAVLRRHLYQPAEVLLAGGKLYRQTMRRAIEIIDRPGVTIIEPSPARGIGDIRAAIVAFVEQSPLVRPRLL